MAALYGSYFSEEESAQVQTGDELDILCDDGMNYHATVLKHEWKRGIVTLSFSQWDKENNIRGSIRKYYLAKRNTYSAGLSEQNVYTAEQTKARRTALYRRIEPPGFATGARYDRDYLSKPRLSLKRRIPGAFAPEIENDRRDSMMPQTEDRLASTPAVVEEVSSNNESVVGGGRVRKRPLTNDRVVSASSNVVAHHVIGDASSEQELGTIFKEEPPAGLEERPAAAVAPVDLPVVDAEKSDSKQIAAVFASGAGEDIGNLRAVLRRKLEKKAVARGHIISDLEKLDSEIDSMQRGMNNLLERGAGLNHVDRFLNLAQQESADMAAAREKLESSLDSADKDMELLREVADVLI